MIAKAQKLADQVRLLAADVDKALSVRGGRARKGEPPRERTGKLRRNIRWRVLPNLTVEACIDARTPRGFRYGDYLDHSIPGLIRSGRHPFIVPAVARQPSKLKVVVTCRSKW